MDLILSSDTPAVPGQPADSSGHPNCHHEMFFKPTVLSRLQDVDYRFRSPRLREHNARFRDALIDTDRRMPVKRFAPLNQIAASIQF